jgi:ABC-type amino acid transport substrate-binding protein
MISNGANMLKLCNLIILLLLSSILFADASGNSLIKLVNQDTLTVSMIKFDRIPFIFTDSNGDLQGFDVELAKQLADKLGVEVKFLREANSFNEVVDLVADGKADIGISLLSRTLTRAQKVKFSNPYVILHPAILYNFSDPIFIKKKKPFEAMKTPNIKIGEAAGTSYVEWAHELFPEAEISEYANWEEVFFAISNNEIQGTLYYELSISIFMQKHPELLLRLKTTKLDIDDTVGIAVNRDNDQLLYWINLFLEVEKIKTTPRKLIEQYKDFIR